jgi:opacity protein-like surface antigen
MPDVLTVEKQGFSVLDGYALGGTIGRYVHPQGRSEIEFTFRDNRMGDFQLQRTVDDVLTVSDVTDVEGSMESYSLMLNVLVDFEERRVGRMNLYGGGGLGVLYVEGDATGNFLPGFPGGPPATFQWADSGFAFQGIVGVNLQVAPRWSWFTEYRYLGSDTITVDDVTNNVSQGNYHFDSHNVLFGFRMFK